MIREKFTIGPSEDAKRIRQEVFVEEQGFKDEFDDDDPSSLSLVLYLDDEPLGTARIVKVDPETYKLGRVAVRKKYRGQKVGTYLIKFMEVKARTMGCRKLITDAQLDKMGFYESVGFKEDPNGEVFLEEGVPHMRMSKEIVRIRKKRSRRPKLD